MIRCAWVMPALVAIGVAAPAWGQVDIAESQAKLLSKRAAEADAYRKLAESIKGLQITSDTYVKDFVAESDEIRTHLDQFIKGVRLGRPQWFDDLSCEIPAEVTVERVVQILNEIHQRYYKGRHVKAKDIVDMQQHIERKIIKVVGKGAPRPDLPPELPEGVAEQVMEGAPLPEPFTPDLWKRMGPQARLSAERAAEVDAQRKLLERILGLRITSDTIVRDFVAESDEIRTTASGTLVGFTKKQTYYHADEPIVEVTLEVPLESVITTIKELHTRCQHCGHVKGSDITEITRSLERKVFEATGTGVPNPRFLQQYNAMLAMPAEQLPDWAMRPVVATGTGLPPEDKAGTPQGKLLAARAAEVDAKRKLAEKIKGFRITADTLVKDFVSQYDEVRTYLDAVIANAEVQKTRFREDGTAEVTVMLQGLEVWDVVRQQPGAPMAPPQMLPPRGRPGAGGPPPGGPGGPPPAGAAPRRPAPRPAAPPPPPPPAGESGGTQ